MGAPARSAAPPGTRANRSSRWGALQVIPDHTYFVGRDGIHTYTGLKGASSNVGGLQRQKESPPQIPYSLPLSGSYLDEAAHPASTTRTQATTEEEALEVLIDCIRPSAQDTLLALWRKGYTIAKR